MNIITRFTVASDEGIDVLLFLTKKLAEEKFLGLLEPDILATYIAQDFNKKTLVTELNSMSSQWLVVYADRKPVGYARVTSKGKKPVLLENKRAIRIADFAILKEYSAIEIKKALFEKCLSICKHLDGVWINEYFSNPCIDFFENHGFVRQPEAYLLDELELPSVSLVRSNNAEKK
ncbi:MULTISPECIES: N-acetyltransferase [Sphingobacterium]|uniref:N-acetyltransferase n=1 Tax=Sphingobacterium TaxID=28453 RepID=UPI002580E333|nr:MULTISPECIES: N-acetyltransferase [Sphingobacterium]